MVAHQPIGIGGSPADSRDGVCFHVRLSSRCPSRFVRFHDPGASGICTWWWKTLDRRLFSRSDSDDGICCRNPGPTRPLSNEPPTPMGVRRYPVSSFQRCSRRFWYGKFLFTQRSPGLDLAEAPCVPIDTVFLRLNVGWFVQWKNHEKLFSRPRTTTAQQSVAYLKTVKTV